MPIDSIARLFDLSGMGAIVTGGAKGIGQAIAYRLGEAGAGVMVADIDLEAAWTTAREVTARGGTASAIHADAGSVRDAKKAMAATVETLGRVDILVNNAGIYPISPVLDISEELWDRTHNINLRGLFFYSQAAAHEMVRVGRGGRIINIASIDALHPAGEVAHYNASKGGVVMLTKAMALELGPHKILVNAVAPGGITTPGTRSMGSELVAKGKAKVGEDFGNRLPIGRWGRPDDIAKVVLFLASRAADYMTGTLLVVDGGFLLS